MTETDWWNLIDQSPDDRDLRIAFSCWLQDECDDPVGAKALWWQVAHDRRLHREVTFHWYDAGGGWNKRRGTEARLPSAVFRCLAEGDLISSGGATWRWYSWRWEAERDLVRAFRRAVAEGWDPDSAFRLAE
jgi:hypothetical protein